VIVESTSPRGALVAPASLPQAAPGVERPPVIVAPAAPVPSDTSSLREARTTAQPARAASDRLAVEAALITEVRAAIEAGRTDDALAGLRRHRREFADGVLQPERLGLRAIALCRAERAREGRSAAEALLRAHPDSALAARVRLDCDLPADAHAPKNSPPP
jgi:hypothetical protein